MTWIDKILPILGVAFGWLLSQYGKYSTDKKDDIRKFKKLLYSLLELRWLLKNELEFEKDFSKFLSLFKEKISTKFGEDIEGIESEIKALKPILMQQIKNKLTENDRIKNVEQNIDSTIAELSEIYPVFAYQLNGQYKIKERLEKVDDYLNEFEQYFTESDFIIKDWMQPKLTNELLERLDSSVLEIAKKIGRKTKKEVSELIKETKLEENEDLQNFMNECLEQMKTNANNV